jgi:hypothetical protein
MTTPVAGLLVAALVIVAIYILFVVPGERKYHETKLKLMQERIERREKAKQGSDAHSGEGERPSRRR